MAGLGSIINTVSRISIEDEFLVPDAQKVIFECIPKEVRVEAVLSGEISFDIQANWENALGTVAGSTGSNIIDSANRVTQMVSGYTIQQPWFSRKLYAGTTPIMFTVPIKLMAWDDANTEVTKKLYSLMSLLYPRLAKDSPLLGGAVASYHVPGPSLFWPNKSIGLPGDTVSVKVGQLINYTGCYIEGLQARIPNVYTKKGDPHIIEVNIKVSAIDTAFVNANNQFMPFIDQVYSIGSLQETLREEGGFTGLISNITSSF